MLRSVLGAIIALIIVFSGAYAQRPLAGATRTDAEPGLGGYDVPFVPGGTHREDVRSPGDFLGRPLGSRAATHAEILSYAGYLADSFGNVELHEYARTYEGRRLVYLVITSPSNAERLGTIRTDLGKLADPRGVSDATARKVIDTAPAVAWMGYGIHGDELSSCDAALELAYQLVAGTDEDTRRIRDNVVTIIDPLQNPDGRERWLGMLEQYNGVVPSYDIQSMHHTGVWPAGRTNHYLFDLNRDWFSLVHPETRGKIAAVLEWTPQYVLDCHEMYPTDTYLLSPPREPFNPFMVDYIHKWWDRVAADQAAAFDRYGWSYYTREWNEEFFPGYGSSWGIYLGAVGMLFEQAGVDGSRVKRPEGTVMTYRETVHHQFVGSYSNLLTVAENREELLNDYYRVKRQNVSGGGGAFVFIPTENTSRLERLVTTLEGQHIEIEQARSGFRGRNAVARDGTREGTRDFPAGSVIVRTNQPLKQLVDAILTFDIRIPTSFLETERKDLLKHHRTRLYDTTGWSLAHAYALDAWFVENLPRVDTGDYEARPHGGLSGDETMVGYVFDCRDDRSVLLIATLLERGYKVWASRRPFAVEGREFARGSYLIRLNGNVALDPDDVRRLAEEAGVDVYAAPTSLGGDLADLGGNEFRLLEQPRIALVGGSPIAYTHFGAMWHLLDARVRIRTSTLDVGSLGRVDLNRYNVIVLPHNWGGPMNYKQQLGESGVNKLRDWVEDGGTLIAEGNAVAFLADTSVAMTSVRQRRQALDELDAYAGALADARDAEEGVVDSLAVWEGGAEKTSEKSADAGPSADSKPDKESARRADVRTRRLFPRGTVLTTTLDDEHWLTAGCEPRVPVMFNTDFAYLAKGNVQVAARLAPAGDLRLAGLLWPEARKRWADTVYAARESSGKGQVILFATLPDFRGYFYGAERMLLNALLLGPGLGTAGTIEW
jgi:hypothetical protein